MNKHRQHANRKEDWETPPAIFQGLDQVLDFTIDLAANEKNKTLGRFVGPGSKWCQDFFHLIGRDLDGHRGYINPPYGRHLPAFTEHIARLAGERAKIGALLPASFDTGWFHDNILPNASAIYCRRGRIQFLYNGKRPMRTDKNGRTVPNSNTGANIFALFWQLRAGDRLPELPGWEPLIAA